MGIRTRVGITGKMAFFLAIATLPTTGLAEHAWCGGMDDIDINLLTLKATGPVEIASVDVSAMKVGNPFDKRCKRVIGSIDDEPDRSLYLHGTHRWDED